MDRLSQISSILHRLEKLTDSMCKLKHSIDTLSSDINDKSFLHDEIVERVKTDLSVVMDQQDQAIREFSVLGIGDVPNTIPGMETIVNHENQRILDKAEYVDAVGAFLKMKSTDAASADILSIAQNSLEKINYDGLTVEECKENLSKYVQFVKVCREQDPKKRFELLWGLNGLFDVNLIYALNTGFITLDTEEKEELTHEVAKDVSVPEVIEGSDTGKIANEENLIVTTKLPSEAFSEDVKGMSQETRNDKNSLTEELTKETTAKEEIEKRLVFEITERVIPSYPGSRTSKFETKKFRDDIFYIGKSALKVLNFLGEYTCGTNESIALDTGISVDIISNASEKLSNLGYLEEYKLEDLGGFYTLSKKGRKVFKTKETASVLKRKPCNDAELGRLIDYTAYAVLTRICFTSAFSLVTNIFPDGSFKISEHILDTNFFIANYETVGESKAQYPKTTIAGIYSNNPKEIASFTDKLMSCSSQSELLVMVGSVSSNLDALCSYIREKCAEKLKDDKEVWIYNNLKKEAIDACSSKVVNYIDKGKLLVKAAASEDIVIDRSDISEELISDKNSISELDGDKSVQLSDIKDDGSEKGNIPEHVIKTNNESAETENAELTEETPTELNSGDTPLVDESKHAGIAEPVLPEHLEDQTVAEKDSDSIADSTDEVKEKNVGSPYESNTDTTSEGSSLDSAVLKAAIQIEELTEGEKNYIYEESNKMLEASKFYCASAYLKAASNKYSEYGVRYQQLAYALNDPLLEKHYSSNAILDIFFSKEGASEYLTIAATLRNFFTDQNHYDYSLQMLRDAVMGYDLIAKNSALSRVLYEMEGFKAKYHRGIDFYADYREEKRSSFDGKLKQLRARARDYYENTVLCISKEKTFHERYTETLRIIYGPDSDIATYLEAIKEDNRDLLELMIDFLNTSYIRDNMEMVPENLDSSKIELIIDNAWNKANTKNKHFSSDLTGSYRNSLYRQIITFVTLICEYAVLVNDYAVNANDEAFVAFNKMRKSLFADVKESAAFIWELKVDNLSGKAEKMVLCKTLEEICQRLDGSFDEDSRPYYYVDFLRGNQVLLDDNYLPILEEVPEIDSFSVLRRIEQHFVMGEKSFGQRLDEIYKGDDDYGSARLILSYLKKHPEEGINPELLKKDLEEASSFPRKNMPSKKKDFIEDMELAQFYGQIDNTKENRNEIFIDIMESRYEMALNDENYGFFCRILDAIRNTIKDEAKERAKELEKNLAIYLETNESWESDETVRNAVEKVRERISVQNYAAAEDLLNRLITGDLTSNSELFEKTDYLIEFLNEYAVNANKAGVSGATLQANSRALNKDARGANRLIGNWPKQKGTSAEKIQDLLSGLGFAVSTVTKQDEIQGKDHYYVELRKPINGRKTNYTHPISVFGSEAETNGFRVVCVFGKMDAERLIDTFKEIGNAKHTIVLLDFSLTLPERRKLARLSKINYTGKTFAVIDRIAIVYLAQHYSETAINRMLMAVIMPFAACQPYVMESTRNMPQEIFMGRKRELERIESPSGVNIVYGGRQLGKSALLKMAQKEINNDENHDRAVLVDVKDHDYRAAAKKISAALYDEGVLKRENITDDWSVLARDIKNRLREEGKDRIPYLLLLIDEADAFIESSEEIRYSPFDNLKDIQSIGNGRFKFVVAGLRNIVRFNRKVALGNNSVIAHLSAITITPFNSSEARELLEVPLYYLGFRFQNNSKTNMLISTICGTTNYFPGLLQMYASNLLEAMKHEYAGYVAANTPPYIVSEEHIKKALSDKDLAEQIREKFDITLRIGGDDYYYLIALLVAYNYHFDKSDNGCSPEKIKDLANTFEIGKINVLTIENISALMEEMRELNVLQEVSVGRYRFTRHGFCQMMGSKKDIEEQICAIIDAVEG